MKTTLILDERPVSWQHSYAHRAFGKGKMVKFMTAKAKEYKEMVIERWKSSYGDDVMFESGPLKVTITLELKGKRKLDIDNGNKLILDSLNNLAYTDDNQIEELHVFKAHNKDRDLITLEIEPL